MKQPDSQQDPRAKRTNRRLMAAAAVASAVIGVTVIGVTGANAAPGIARGGPSTEYVQVMSTATTGGPASAIARGAFTAAGEAHVGSGRTGTFVFPGGTITFSHHTGRQASQFDPRTCLNVISQSGTYQITGGTGRYAGIGGHGTYQLSLEFVAARSHGQCTSGRPPAAEQELLRLSGPVQR